MTDIYFAALNDKTGNYLRRPKTFESATDRPRFAATGELVKFESLFSAIEFFEESRFELEYINLVKCVTNVTEIWSFDKALDLKKEFFA